MQTEDEKYVHFNLETPKDGISCVILGFRRGVDETFVLTGYYAASLIVI